MTAKTRLISASPHDVFLIAEQAITGLRTKKIDRSDNRITAHVKRGFGRTSTLTVAVDRLTTTKVSPVTRTQS